MYEILAGLKKPGPNNNKKKGGGGAILKLSSVEFVGFRLSDDSQIIAFLNAAVLKMDIVIIRLVWACSG